MNTWMKISRQFGKPSGILGGVAGFIMSHRSSNIQRNKWGISLLNLRPNDNVLEIGFGPGIAIKMMSEKIDTGSIYGIDHSELMLRNATDRNIEAINSGKVKLFLGSVGELPKFDRPIDKILDINSFQFWQNLGEQLISLKNKMALNGTIALVHQPRKPGSTSEDSELSANNFADILKSAGFKNIRTEKLMLKPVPAICVLGYNC